MRPEIIIEVQGKPQAWQRVKRGKYGKPYVPPETAAYKEAIGLAANKAMGGAIPFDGPVELHATFFMPIPKRFTKGQRRDAITNRLYPVTRPDTDNLLKGVLDGIDKIVTNDDAQVVRVTATKYYSETPRTEVLIRPL